MAIGQFCKIFETLKHGQILVKLDAGPEGDPEVRVYVQPPNLGICSLAISFKDTDSGHDSAECMFAELDEAKSVTFADDIFKQMKELEL